MLDKFLRHVAGMYQAETGAKVSREGGAGDVTACCVGGPAPPSCGWQSSTLPALLRLHTASRPCLPATAGAFGGGVARGRGGGHPFGVAEGGARG